MNNLNMKRFLFLIIALICISCQKEETPLIIKSDRVYDEYCSIAVLLDNVSINIKSQKECIVTIYGTSSSFGDCIIKDKIIGNTSIKYPWVPGVYLDSVYLEFIDTIVYYNIPEKQRIVSK